MSFFDFGGQRETSNSNELHQPRPISLQTHMIEQESVQKIHSNNGGGCRESMIRTDSRDEFNALFSRDDETCRLGNYVGLERGFSLLAEEGLKFFIVPAKIIFKYQRRQKGSSSEFILAKGDDFTFAFFIKFRPFFFLLFFTIKGSCIVVHSHSLLRRRAASFHTGKEEKSKASPIFLSLNLNGLCCS